MAHTKQSIKDLLAREDVIGMHAIGRALLVLRDLQTRSEIEVLDTHVMNMRGFTKGDGKRGPLNALFYEERGMLTDAQVRYWRVRDVRGAPRIAKYWKQLLREADRKARERALAAAND